MKMSKFSDFLNKEFLCWQQETGQRQTLRKFAEYLGFKPTTLSNWLNSSTSPEGYSLYKLAARLGDEVYKVLGEEKIDYFVEQFSEVPPELKEAVFAAFREIDSALSDKAIILSPAEKNRLIESIMNRYGFARTNKK